MPSCAVKCCPRSNDERGQTQPPALAAELNKGESCNALARAVCFHRLGRLRDRTTEAQQHRASGLALVTAAIALWNTVYLGGALDACAAAESACRIPCSRISPRSAGSTST